MPKSTGLHFLAVVEKPAPFNYRTSPRMITTIEWTGALPSNRSQRATLSSIQGRITAQLSNYLPSEGGRLLIWLLDADENPALFVTGLIDQKDGKLNQQQLEARLGTLIPQITCKQTMTEMEVTVSATAELNFTEGYDYNLDDYEGEGELRDEEIAEEMVADCCGHLEQSDATIIGRVEDCLMVDAHVTETVTIEVPWQTDNALETDQLAFMIEQATDELMGLVDIASRFVNVSIDSFTCFETQAT